MSSTRYAPPGADPDASPERYLASTSVRGIAIGMNIIARIGRTLPPAERAAMYWLSNYARLLDLTQDSLSAVLDLDRREIREALTNPAADRSRFVRQVTSLRRDFENGLDIPRHERTTVPAFKARVFREAYCRLAPTKILRKVRNAIRFAERDAEIVEIVGETRLGKTVACASEFFRRLDHAAWCVVPKAADFRSFLYALADSLGVSTSRADKIASLTDKIHSAVGPARITTLFLEEAHRLHPRDIRHDPIRLDFIRDLWEYHGINVIIIATPQFTAISQARLNGSSGWEAGQWVGRVQAFDLPSTLDDGDLRAIASNHLPQADAPTLDQLVAHAKSSRGYAGIMVKSIERARFIASDTDAPVDVELIRRAQTQIDRQARQQALAPNPQPRTRRTNP